MPTIEPTPERIQELASAADDGPVVMINLLRYREHAAYPPGFDATPCSGEQAYARYAAAVSSRSTAPAFSGARAREWS